ncbi:MAG: SAM-dependent methyltransferase [Armatimonadota bacterium]|nr:SAM-dependent methyltransferase [Armatimonadota bacterium]
MRQAKIVNAHECPFVGKGGLKLKFALDYFGISVDGLICADLGCNVGGFTDCLLQAGAAKVYAVDTSYGILAWKLRTDKRVVVCERTNALFWSPPEPLSIIVSDLGWTKQEKALPAIARILEPNGEILSLVKPQYEAPKSWLVRGVLPENNLSAVLELVRSTIPKELDLVGEVRSPYLGTGGNIEYWWRLKK